MDRTTKIIMVLVAAGLWLNAAVSLIRPASATDSIFYTIRSDVSVIRSDVSVIRSDVSVIRSDVSATRSVVSTIRSVVSTLYSGKT